MKTERMTMTELQPVNFIGNFFGSSGYAVHCRNLALAYSKINNQTSIDCPKPQNWEANVNDQELTLLKKPAQLTGTQIFITDPSAALLKANDACQAVIPWMVFEGDKAPRQWAEWSEHFPLILCPSQHNKKALVSAGINENKIRIIPHGYNPEHYHPTNTKNHDKCVFFWNKGWSKGVHDRSAFHTALQAFINAFHDNPDVVLIAHLNPAYTSPGWNLNEELAKANIKGLATKKCQVQINAQNLPESELRRLYNQAHFYLGTSKADAFNMGCLEAMACATPIITSSFTGVTDYAPECAKIVKGTLEPVTGLGLAEKYLYEQTQWLNLDLDQYVQTLKECYKVWKDDKEQYEQWRTETVKKAEKYTWEKAALKLHETLNELSNSQKRKSQS